MDAQLDPLDGKLVDRPACDEPNSPGRKPATTRESAEEVGDLGDVVVAEAQIDAADHLIGGGIDDSEDGPRSLLPCAGCALDVGSRGAVVGQPIVPRHPSSDVELRVDLPDRGRIGVPARPEKQLAIPKRRVGRYERPHV